MGAIELTAVSLFLDANSKITTWVQHKEYLQKVLAVSVCAESVYPVYRMALKIELIFQQSTIVKTILTHFKVNYPRPRGRKVQYFVCVCVCVCVCVLPQNC